MPKEAPLGLLRGNQIPLQHHRDRITEMEKFFNTAGPIQENNHYFIPVAQRINLGEILTLIDQEKYFVLHAPRQSGKTTTLLELCKILNTSGRYKCLYVNVERAQAARERIGDAMEAIVKALINAETIHLGENVIAGLSAQALEHGQLSALNDVLAGWTRQSPLPTIVFIDEIDSLIGDTLISVLRQLRDGYASRPRHFPQSIILCGVRDVRDYRIHASSEKAPVTGGSAFNINSKSLTVGPFSRQEVSDLYHQHTKATGQTFTAEALTLAFDLTNGQPWLVNALAYETCFENPVGKDRTHPITADMILEAKESLILRRVTHLDQLADKLKEPRVHSLINPMLRGEDISSMNPDHISYALDLGLIVRTREGLKIANPIYQEVIPRELSWMTQLNLEPRVSRQWYIAPDGSIAVEKLLEDFQKFFRQNSETWIERFDYKEAGPQLLLQAYLQRVVNGGGRIAREYGHGRGRTDILLTWPYGSQSPGGHVSPTEKSPEKRVQKVVFELKILHGSKKKTLTEGLEQTKMYLDHVDHDEGHLLIFNRNKKVPWSKKIFRKEHRFQGYKITVWGM